MTRNESATFAIFADTLKAESAIHQLTSAGFSNQDISLLLSDNHEPESSVLDKLPKAAAIGAGLGGAVGGTLGLLAGMGALAIPGAGPLIAAGPVMASLAGLGIGGVAGGLVGALIALGIPEFEAKSYESRLKDGGVLLSIRCATPRQIADARAALEAAGAEDITYCEDQNPESVTAVVPPWTAELQT